MKKYLELIFDQFVSGIAIGAGFSTAVMVFFKLFGA